MMTGGTPILGNLQVGRTMVEETPHLCLGWNHMEVSVSSWRGTPSHHPSNDGMFHCKPSSWGYPHDEPETPSHHGYRSTMIHLVHWFTAGNQVAVFGGLETGHRRRKEWLNPWNPLDLLPVENLKGKHVGEPSLKMVFGIWIHHDPPYVWSCFSTLDSASLIWCGGTISKKKLDGLNGYRTNHSMRIWYDQ